VDIVLYHEYTAASSWDFNRYHHFKFSLTDLSVAFGDSYTYVQGTAGLQNFSFIGDLQNFSYTPQQLLSNEIVQNQVCPLRYKSSSVISNYLAI
jgi:hypothetical protein